jgi:uncharacterized repeat protein (TIGR03837 family)
VRLWLDDASALAWMAPAGLPPLVQVLAWPAKTDLLGAEAPGDVVIEAFGCQLPDAVVARMATKPKPPHWINLEYLSAESYVERSHGLQSPQFSGPGRGLIKHFFYPGFTPRTGGLLREPGLLARQEMFDPQAWLAGQGLQRLAQEQVVSLFAYPNLALPGLLELLAGQPTLLLVCPGAVQQQIARMNLPQTLRCHALPYLSQPDYDHLLWASDLNFVRGEDSFVRAQWAAKPFVWQIYPQDDGAHELKLTAFLDQWLDQAEPDLALQSRQLWQAWNGLRPWASIDLPEASAATAHTIAWRQHLLGQADLTGQLLKTVRDSS